MILKTGKVKPLEISTHQPQTLRKKIDNVGLGFGKQLYKEGYPKEGVAPCHGNYELNHVLCITLYIYMLQPTQTAAPAVPIHQSPQIMIQGGLRVGGRKWVGNIRTLRVCVSTSIRALRHSLFSPQLHQQRVDHLCTLNILTEPLYAAALSNSRSKVRREMF